MNALVTLKLGVLTCLEARFRLNIHTWYLRAKCITPARTLFISGLKSRVMKLPFLSLTMMAKSGLEFILKFTQPLQIYLLSCQANSANLGRYFCTGQHQLWRGSVNFKINSRPLLTIISNLKNGNFMTRDFSPLIKRVLAGVIGYLPNLNFWFFLKSDF